MKLEVKNLKKSFGEKEVLHEISFSVESGSALGLLGRNGAGKTTTIRILMDVFKSNGGEILLDGKPLGSYRGACPVQMVWQHPETVVDPLLRLGTTLDEAGQVEERLKRELHIEEGWLERFPSELSGGELQRFCLARALHPGVKFLLCDEISAMLDLVTQAQIWQFLLAEAKRRSLGLLVVSHDDSLLEQVCTRVVDLPFPSWRIY